MFRYFSSLWQRLFSSLLKTVKAAEDKASRGTRALEVAVDSVTNDLKILDNANASVTTATPEVRLQYVSS